MWIICRWQDNTLSSVCEFAGVAGGRLEWVRRPGWLLTTWLVNKQRTSSQCLVPILLPPPHRVGCLGNEGGSSGRSGQPHAIRKTWSFVLSWKFNVVYYIICSIFRQFNNAKKSAVLTLISNNTFPSYLLFDKDLVKYVKLKLFFV